MKKSFPINDNWLFGRGFDPACLEADFDFSSFYVAALPHNNAETDERSFDESGQRAMCTYARVLTVPDRYNGSRLILRFCGVLSYAEVYVNGIFVASHKGEAPFEADITAPVKYGYGNRIIVKADSSVRRQVPSAGLRGPELIYGGIHRDVFFEIFDGQDIRDVFVCTPSVGEEQSAVSVLTELYDYYPDTQIEAAVLDAGGRETGILPSKSVQGAQVLLKGEIAGVVPWTCDNPVLYTVRVRLTAGKKILDERTVPFGFVRAVFRRDGFTLNGRLTKLIGLNRADGYPRLGRAAPASQQRSDARLIKNLGCNVVRTLGIPSEDFVDECARIGLLVIEDIGGDGFLGVADWRDAVVDTVSAMVRRDRSKPCVVAWGVRVNHSLDCDALYFKTNKAAKDLDPSRATLGARDFLASRVFEDVFAHNDYSRRGIGGRGSGKLFVPYLVSEHTGKSFPARSGDGEAVLLEQAMRHLFRIDRALSGGRTAGAIGMGFADFNTGTGLGGGDNVCHYGVTDMWRNPKPAGYAYRSQQDAEAVLEPAGSLAPDAFSGALYVFTNCDSVRLFRDGKPAGEFFPAFRLFPDLKHPPVVIDDFAGDIPEEDGVTGLKKRAFAGLLRAAFRRGPKNLRFADRLRAAFLKKTLHVDDAGLQRLTDKYAVLPPEGVRYRLEGIREGKTVLSRQLGGPTAKTLILESGAETFECDKSYEVVRFSVRCEDGRGNRLWDDFSPVGITVTGAAALVGPPLISLKGGAGGFYVRSVSPGLSRVTVKTDYGEQSKELEVKYGTMERL